MTGGPVDSRAAARKAAALLFLCLAIGVAAFLTGCGNPLIQGGSLHFQAGRYDQAAQVFQDAIAKSPADAEAHLWLARTWSELGHIPDAVTEYDRAVTLRSSLRSPAQEHRLHYWRVQEARGEGFLREAEVMKSGARKTERLKQASEALESAALLRPDKALTDYQLSLLSSALGKEDRATDYKDAAFRKAASDPESRDILLPVVREKADKAVMANHYSEARSLYETAVLMKPDDPGLLGDLATTLLLLAEDSGTPPSDRAASYHEAARLLERVRRREPNDPEALYNLATVRGRLGQWASADSVLRVYMGLKPRDPDAYALMNEVADGLSRSDDARTADYAGQVLSSGKPVPDAARWAREAFDRFGVRSGVGRLYSELGVPDEVRTLKKKNGDLVEVWFYFSRGRVAAFQDGEPAGGVLKFGRS